MSPPPQSPLLLCSLGWHKHQPLLLLVLPRVIHRAASASAAFDSHLKLLNFMVKSRKEILIEKTVSWCYFVTLCFSSFIIISLNLGDW